MTIIHKILVPVDFSSYSQEATQYACKLAKQNNASVTLLHVYELTPYMDPMGFAAFDARIVDSIKSATEESLRNAKEEAQKLWTPQIETLLVMGVPFEAITQTAKEGGYDLIVLGTHGRTGLKHVLLGSVAERVVRHAHCPVLVVRPTTPSK